MRYSTPTGVLRDMLTKIGLPNLIEFDIDDFEYKLMFDHVQKQHPGKTQDEQEAMAIARLAWLGYGMPEASSGAKEKLIEDARSREIEGIHTEARSLIRNQFPELRKGIGDGLERISQSFETLTPNLMNAIIDSGGRNRDQVKTSTSHIVTVLESCAMKQTEAFERKASEFMTFFKRFSFAALLLFLIFLVLFFVPKARAQVDCVGFYTSAGALVRNYCAPFRMKEGTGITFSAAGNTLTIAAGAGAGTVTSFSSGNLSPLFTTSVATATTTPALSFTLSNAAALTLFGNNTGGVAAPAFFAPLTTRGDVMVLSSASVIGRVGLGSATANKYLKSDGTDAVVSTGAASGTGACPGGEAVTTLNADAAPTCTAFGGSGTVTNASNLTDNAVVIGDGGTVGVQTAVGFTTDGTSAMTLGVAGTGTGKVTFAGTTSGSGSISVAAAAGTPSDLLLPTTSGAAGQFPYGSGASPNQLAWGFPMVMSFNKGAVVGASATSYCPLGPHDAGVFAGCGTTEPLRQVVVPVATTLRVVYACWTTTQNAAGSMTVNIRTCTPTAGACTGSTVLTYTIAAGATANCGNATGTVAVAAGDYISLQFINNYAGGNSAIPQTVSALFY